MGCTYIRDAEQSRLVCILIVYLSRRLFASDHQIFITNIGRTNGTLLNGDAITARTRVQHSDVVSILNVQYSYRIGYISRDQIAIAMDTTTAAESVIIAEAPSASVALSAFDANADDMVDVAIMVEAAPATSTAAAAFARDRPTRNRGLRVDYTEVADLDENSAYRTDEPFPSRLPYISPIEAGEQSVSREMLKEMQLSPSSIL